MIFISVPVLTVIEFSCSFLQLNCHFNSGQFNDNGQFNDKRKCRKFETLNPHRTVIYVEYFTDFYLQSRWFSILFVMSHYLYSSGSNGSSGRFWQPSFHDLFSKGRGAWPLAPWICHCCASTSIFNSKS